MGAAHGIMTTRVAFALRDDPMISGAMPPPPHAPAALVDLEVATLSEATCQRVQSPLHVGGRVGVVVSGHQSTAWRATVGHGKGEVR